MFVSQFKHHLDEDIPMRTAAAHPGGGQWKTWELSGKWAHLPHLAGLARASLRTPVNSYPVCGQVRCVRFPFFPTFPAKSCTPLLGWPMVRDGKCHAVSNNFSVATSQHHTHGFVAAAFPHRDTRTREKTDGMIESERVRQTVRQQQQQQHKTRFASCEIVA